MQVCEVNGIVGISAEQESLDQRVEMKNGSYYQRVAFLKLGSRWDLFIGNRIII